MLNIFLLNPDYAAAYPLYSVINHFINIRIIICIKEYSLSTVVSVFDP